MISFNDEHKFKQVKNLIKEMLLIIYKLLIDDEYKCLTYKN